MIRVDQETSSAISILPTGDPPFWDPLPTPENAEFTSDKIVNAIAILSKARS